MRCLDKGQVWLVSRGRKKTAKIRWSGQANRGIEHRTVEYKVARRAEMGKGGREGGGSEELKRRQSLIPRLRAERDQAGNGLDQGGILAQNQWDSINSNQDCCH